MISHIHFQTLGVVDLDRAMSFYETLGFEVDRDEPYGDSRWIFMRIPGSPTKLHFEQRDTITGQDTPALALITDDVDRLCKELEAQGVTIESGPADAPWEAETRWATLRDSEGNLVLVQT